MSEQEKQAYDLGFDCGKNGANTTNCHFSIFSTPERTRAWERGKAAADKIRAQIRETAEKIAG